MFVVYFHECFHLDSIIYLTREGDVYEIPLGCFLGDMTDEIAKDYGPGAILTEVVSTGSKSYGYRGVNEDGTEFCTIKSKGFPYSHETSLLVTFDTMIERVDLGMNGIFDKILIPDRGIRRCRDHTVVTRDTSKQFGFTENKRMMPASDSYIMYPFGYDIED